MGVLVQQRAPEPPGIHAYDHDEQAECQEQVHGQALREALASGEIEREEYGAIVRACGLMELTGGGVAVGGWTRVLTIPGHR